jgi:hypothetical protein
MEGFSDHVRVSPVKGGRAPKRKTRLYIIGLPDKCRSIGLAKTRGDTDRELFEVVFESSTQKWGQRLVSNIDVHVA